MRYANSPRARPGTRWSCSDWLRCSWGVLLASARQQRAGLVELLGRIDPERHGIDDRDVDAHAGFERAQLLELIELLQRRRPERSEERRVGKECRSRWSPDQ